MQTEAAQLQLKVVAADGVQEKSNQLQTAYTQLSDEHRKLKNEQLLMLKELGIIHDNIVEEHQMLKQRSTAVIGGQDFSQIERENRELKDSLQEVLMISGGDGQKPG